MNNIVNVPTYKFALREDLKNNLEFLPTRGEPKASGWDVKCAEKNGVKLRPGQKAKIKLGFRGFCPEGWWYELKPRSSTFGKKDLHSLYGTIDELYEGELVFACQYIPEFNVTQAGLLRYGEFSSDGTDLATLKNFPILEINFGEAIGQIIPVRRQEMQVEFISNEEYDRLCSERNGVRGTGGFGSTDSKKDKI